MWNLGRKILAERSLLAIVLAGVLIVSVGMRRVDLGQNEVSYAGAEGEKAGWARCADVVITGDSRVVFGVSGNVMREHLGDLRIVNYGFYGCGYDEQYLRAIDEQFAPDSGQKMLVLGITPHSLTEKARRRNSFKVEKQRFESRTTLQANAVRHPRFFLPMKPSNFVRAILGNQKGKANVRNAKVSNQPDKGVNDGWISSVQSINPVADVDNYRFNFFNNVVTENAVEKLLVWVRKWSSSGILVFGFRPPTSEAMVALEEQLSGFDESDFVERFEAAGGSWIEMDQYKYLSFDGSHLHRDGAIAFSHDLGEKIRLEQGPPTDLARKSFLLSQ
ncbi:MAG: hypothetical protein JXD22_00300 [Sedimentisphaerales bacterium]|nr:hypothetical protein [Sedimentisphaerales bacterium]